MLNSKLYLVSIPEWFDLKKRYTKSGLEFTEQVSIPEWFDLKPKTLSVYFLKKSRFNS